MLTATATIEDRVEGLGLGADDYLPKPFDIAELVARIRALARRTRPALPPVLVHGDLRLDPARREATRAGRTLELGPKEFAVLQLLLEAQGTVVSAEELLERAWAPAAAPCSRWPSPTPFPPSPATGPPAKTCWKPATSRNNSSRHCSPSPAASATSTTASPPTWRPSPGRRCRPASRTPPRGSWPSRVNRPAPVLGDARLLQRLAAILIDNAIRHNSPGGRIDIRRRGAAFASDHQHRAGHPARRGHAAAPAVPGAGRPARRR